MFFFFFLVQSGLGKIIKLIYLLLFTEVYCQISFKDFLVGEQDLEDIELPRTVKRGKVVKSSFLELEVSKVLPKLMYSFSERGF